MNVPAMVLSLTTLFSPLWATAQNLVPDPLYQAVGPCGDSCIIRSNAGGVVSVFEKAAEYVRAGGRHQIIIDGPCESACVYLADLMREQTCQTVQARFAVHMWRNFPEDAMTQTAGHFRLKENTAMMGFLYPKHRPDFNAWVQRNGGYPKWHLLKMATAEAMRFWPLCTLERPP